MAIATRITLIVPLRLTGRTYEAELRLARLCDNVPRDLFDILISDYGTEAAHSGPLTALEEAGIAICRHPSPHSLFSIGHARDFGVQNARQPVIMFNDIDFCGTEAMYRAIHAEVVRRDLAQNAWDFFCVPVLFLTGEGTRLWLDAAAHGQDLFERIDVDQAEKATDMIQSTAYGSSAMVINRRHYLAVGGHDKAFSGHGAEDYDILHRLSALAPLGARPHDYRKDYRNNGVRHYWGFRPYFALYGLAAFSRGLHLVHLWHPRRQEKGYFRAAQNFKHLRRLMVGFDRRARQPEPLTDLACGTRRLLVLVGTRNESLLVRPLLARSAKYIMMHRTGCPDPAALSALAEANGAELVLLAPSLSAALAKSSGTSASLSPILCMQAESLDRDGRVTLQMADGTASVSTTVAAVRAPDGIVVGYQWEPVTVPELGDVGAPPPAPPQLFEAALFASFGANVGDRKRHPRPPKRAKSPLWVRAWRRLTGH